MITAMGDAVRSLLDELNPVHIRAATEEHNRTAVLPLQRKARAFEQYEITYARTAQAYADNFNSVFGNTFGRTYERVVRAGDNRPGARDTGARDTGARETGALGIGTREPDGRKPDGRKQ